MSNESTDQEPTQAVSPGAAPTQDQDENQGRSDMVDPARAAGAEFEAEPGSGDERR